MELIGRFLVVAEELHFTWAAARPGLAQPPLSAAMAPSEAGVRPLERTSRRVALTPAGAVLLEQRPRRGPARPTAAAEPHSPGRPAAAAA